MLGFDVDPERTARLLAEWNEFRETQFRRRRMRRQEDEILNIFVDICSLFRSKPKVNDESRRSAQHRSLSVLLPADARHPGRELPPTFIAALRRAVAHYGVTTLDRSPELEESLLWIYKSHQRLEQQIRPDCGSVAAPAARGAPSVSSRADESFRNLLDRMISDHPRLVPRGQRPGAGAAVSLLRSAAIRPGRKADLRRGRRDTWNIWRRIPKRRTGEEGAMR